MPYRTWQDRRKIIAAIIAQGATSPLDDFDLSESERVYFIARSRKAVYALARKTSTFKSYYRLPTDEPFRFIIWIAALAVASGLLSGAYLFLQRRSDTHPYPLLGTCATIVVASLGWAISAHTAHTNSVRQNTINILLARFSQTTYTDSLHRFHRGFGYEVSSRIARGALRAKILGSDEDKRSVEAVNYILNYFEFLSQGVLLGDLSAKVVRENLRGTICYYYDKCEPYIRESNEMNRRAFDKLIKMRTHFREP